MRKAMEWFGMGLIFFLFCLMLDMSLLGITFQELWADIVCRF